MGKHSIKIEELFRKGIVYENEDTFSVSVFSSQYKRAAKCICKIISDNRRLGPRAEYKGRWHEDEIPNVISIEGMRGTGKTSMMRSFTEALADHGSSYTNEILRDQEADMENVCFFSLGCIDVSIIENPEDVFELILGNMLEEMEINGGRDDFEKYNDLHMYEKRQIIQEIEKIYVNFSDMKNGKTQDLELEYSPFESLRDNAISQSIRIRFAKLVKRFLKYHMDRINETRRIKYEEAYMVITIDDLDMAQYNRYKRDRRQVEIKPYEIMNSMSAYLSVPGIIVFTSYHLDNLSRQCRKLFSQEMDHCVEHSIDVEQNIRARDDYVGELTSQLLEKVLPSIYRIYMPTWKKMDLAEQMICIDISSAVSGGSPFQGWNNDPNAILSTRDFILAMYAGESGIYYDPIGEKRHFLEAYSLRSLVYTFQLLVNEGTFEKWIENKANSENEDNHRNSVIKRVKNDLYYRFIKENLPENSAEMRQMKRLSGFTIDRRAEEIHELIAPEIDPLDREKIKELQQLEEERSIIREGLMLDDEYERVQAVDERIEDIRRGSMAYSYAELLHCLYRMTRDGLYSKNFMYCILHSFSIQLNECYREFRQTRKYSRNRLHDLESNKSYKVLKRLIGKSICESWTGYLFPQVDYVGEKSADEFKGTNFQNRNNDPITLGYIEKTRFEYEYTYRSGMEEAFFSMLIFVLNLFNDVMDWQSMSISLQKSADGWLIKMDYKNNPTFEVTSFINYAFAYEEFLEKVDKLVDFEHAIFASRVEEAEEKTMREAMTKAKGKYISSLRREYDNWDKRYGNLAVPIHQFDLFYNVMKRLYKSGLSRRNLIHTDQEGFFIKAIENMVQNIAKELEKIDQHYHICGSARYKEIFMNQPFLAKLLKVIKDSDADMMKEKKKGTTDEFIQGILGSAYGSRISSLERSPA